MNYVKKPQISEKKEFSRDRYYRDILRQTLLVKHESNTHLIKHKRTRRFEGEDAFG